jgi:hypothetical protein
MAFMDDVTGVTAVYRMDMLAGLNSPELFLRLLSLSPMFHIVFVFELTGTMYH